MFIGLLWQVPTAQHDGYDDTNASHQKVVPNPLATKLVSSFTVQTTTEKMASGRPKSASSVVDRLSKPKNTSNKVLDASKSVVLSSEDLVIAKIKEEKKARVAQMARSKRVGGRTSGNFLCVIYLFAQFIKRIL